jgi:hypothetical protein
VPSGSIWYEIVRIALQVHNITEVADIDPMYIDGNRITIVSLLVMDI